MEVDAAGGLGLEQGFEGYLLTGSASERTNAKTMFVSRYVVRGSDRSFGQ